MNYPEIQNNREIRLRAVEPEDVDFLLEMENNPGLWQVSNNLAPYSRYQIEQYVLNAPNDVRSNGQLRLIIEFTGNDDSTTSVGAVDLFDIDLVNRRAGIGITVISPFRRQGIASEALELLKQYSIEHLHLHQLYCSISSINHHSIKLFEKKGFTRCGTRKEWFFHGNKWSDEILYQSFLREE